MDIIARLNWIDWVVIIVIFRISYVAFREGLSHELFPVAGGIFIVILSLHYYNKIGSYISADGLRMPNVLANFLSFLALVVFSGFIFRIAKAILDKLIKVELHPLLERFGGLCLGVLRSAISASIILTVLALTPLPYLQRSIRDRSLVGMHFLKVGPVIYEKASKFFPAMKMEDGPVKVDELLTSLASDKSIFGESQEGAKTKD